MPDSFYVVKKGDTLYKIASVYLGDANKWKDIKKLNNLPNENLLFIGQKIKLPIEAKILVQKEREYKRAHPVVANENKKDGASYMIGCAALFIICDELLPNGKLVRKIVVAPSMPPALLYPEIYGIRPQDIANKGSLADHVQGFNTSRYTSASTLPKGAPNISGRPIYIDIKKAKEAGCTIHSVEEIVADLKRLKAERPEMVHRLDELIKTVTEKEHEVLIEGSVPASAIKNEVQMKWTKGLRVLNVVAIALTVYDLSKAAKISMTIQKPSPLIAESLRQAGGWGAAIAGGKVGFWAGAAISAETGPGAIIGGAIGSLLFGVAGYYGADWIADYIYEN